MKKLSTLLFLTIVLALIDVSYSWAQRGDRASAAARRQRQESRYDLAKIRSKGQTKHYYPAGPLSLTNKMAQRPDSLPKSWMKHMPAMKKRRPTVRPQLSAARKTAGADIPAILYVNYKATGSGEGDTWENAILELADALLYAKDNPGVEQIWVAKGIYYPLYDHNYAPDGDDPRDKTFILPAGVKLYGGFAGTETALSERKLRIVPTLEFGEEGFVEFSTVLSGAFDEISNAYHVVIAAGNAGPFSLDGFTITDGHASGEDDVTVNGETVSRAAGGGIVAVNSTPEFNNLLIVNNYAAQGGAIEAETSDFTLTNSLIVGNESEDATVHIINSSPVVTNITANYNLSGDFGFLFEGAGTFAQIRNSIIYGNFPYERETDVEDGAIANFAYCIVQGSGGSASWDTDFGANQGFNLDEDPMFQDPSLGYYGLMLNSPAINNGNNDYFDASQSPDLSAFTTDLRSTPRILNGTVDIGALESLYDKNLHSDLTPDGDGILYVKKGGAGTMTGDSWENAAPEVADALFASAINFDIADIWVAGGTYHPLYRPDDLSKNNPERKYNSFLIPDGVYLYGGFAGTEFSLEERDLSIAANASILSGDFNGDDNFNFADMAGSGPDEGSENAYLVVSTVGYVCGCGPVLNGFTVEGANNLLGSTDEVIRINDREVPIGFAAGLLVMETALTMDHVVVRNNVGKMSGGLTLYYGGGSITNSLFYHNVDAGRDVFQSDFYEGASGILGIAPIFELTLTNTTVARNLSLSNRPGLHSLLGILTIDNSIVYHNIVSTSPTGENGADFTSYLLLAEASSSIIGGSGGSDDWKLYVFGDDNLSVEDGGGNLDEDPLFKDMDAADFSLSACSKAIDAGNDFGFDESMTDLAGNPRLYGDFYDIGAYEFQATAGFGVTELAGNGKESFYEFTDNTSHTFAAEKGVCSVDILTLTPTTLTGEVNTKVWYDAEVKSFNSAPYLQRHYDIIPANDAENAAAEVTLYFTQAEFDALNEELDPAEYLPTGEPDGEADRIANFRIYQFHGESSDGSGVPSTYAGTRKEIDPDDDKIVWNEELLRWEVTFTVTGFSGFFAGTASQNPLPVRLVSFEGKQTDDQQIKLDWKVVEQESIAAYQVEYSETGKKFKRIGEVAANTLSSFDYTYTDSLPHPGDHAYYRLKIAELDGKTAYSKIIALKLHPAQTLSAYPIPAGNELWIDWKKTGAEYAEFVDMNGRTLKTVKKVSASQKVDISGLPAGVFVLKVKGGSGLKVVKE